MSKKLSFAAGLLASGPLALLIAHAAIRDERAALREIRDTLAELRDRPAPQAETSRPERTAAALDAPVLRAELTRLVREALSAESTRIAVPTAKEAPAPSAENLQAFQDGERLIRQAAQSKLWTGSNREELHRLLAQMTDDQRSRALQLLLPAINRGEIQPEGGGPPL